MVQFFGNFTNRLDSKGRVSVPAPFRAALRALPEDDAACLLVRPNLDHPCLDVWPMSTYAALSRKLEAEDLISGPDDDLLFDLCAETYRIDLDREGRAILPEPLVKHAELTDTAAFAGLLKKFQIWSPEGLERRRQARREEKLRDKQARAQAAGADGAGASTP